MVGSLRASSAALACVCVPARNEEALLPGLFSALAAQGAAAGPWRLCLMLDGCADGSGCVADRLAAEASFSVVVSSAPDRGASAGRARGAALRLGQESLDGRPGLLLTTDADSAPARDWITEARRALARADVAVGRIVRPDASGADPRSRIEAYYDRLYALRRRLDPVPWDPPPHHHFTGGANMAFRSEAYAALGGFSPVASGEDGLIVDEARRAGLRVRHEPRMVVHTSSRLDGRAPGGLAASLRQRPDEVRVSHPAAMAWQYEAHAQARAWHAAPTASGAAVLGRRLGRSAHEVIGAARDGGNGESFATRVVPAPPGDRPVTLAEAEAALDAIELAMRDRAA